MMYLTAITFIYSTDKVHAAKLMTIQIQHYAVRKWFSFYFIKGIPYQRGVGETAEAEGVMQPCYMIINF